MAERAPEPGETPVGGSRRPSRPPRSALPSGYPEGDSPHAGDDWPPSVRPLIDKLPDDACPWLYLAADPDARAAFVTAEHRCEIRPDEVPGPGHQLAYCLTSNHISCPQLRNYEAQRRSEVVSTQSQTAEPAPAPRAPQPVVADFRASMVGGANGAGGGRSRGLAASRVAWAVMGAVGAFVFAAGLVLYSTPDNATSSEPTSEPASFPPTVASTPDPSTPLAAVPPVSPTELAQSLEDTSDVVATPAPDPVDVDEPDIEALSALGPELIDPQLGETPSEPSTPEPEPTPPPTYIVQPGDTLGLIAQNLGISVIDLVVANGITTNTLIFVGDQLQLPAADSDSAFAPLADTLTPAN